VFQPKTLLNRARSLALAAVLATGPWLAWPAAAQPNTGETTIEVAAGQQPPAAAVEAALSQHDVVIRFLGGDHAVFDTKLTWSSGHALAIQAPATLTVAGAAALVAPGAKITIEADQIALLGGVNIDVSAPANPGSILVGGGWQGAQLAMNNATAVFVDEDATFSAAATRSGQGGTVVFWADNVMRFHGQVSARGVAAGGQVEVSGKRALTYTGLADLQASAGPAGTLLLDPDNITISNVPTAGVLFDGISLFHAPDGDSNLAVSDLTTQLGLSSIEVRSTTGSITVTDPVVWTSGNTLTLNAGDVLAVNASITANPGALILKTTGANVAVVPGADITTTGGLTVASAGGATLDGVIDGAGGLTIQATGRVTLSVVNTYTGATTVQSGTLALTNPAAIVDSSGVSLSGGATLDVSGALGGAFVEALSGVAGTTVNLGSQTIWVQGTSSTTFAGNITGSGGLSLLDGGLTLNGTLAYTGSTVVQGALTLDSPLTSAAGSTIRVQGGTLVNNDLLTVGGNFINIGTVTNPGLIVLTTGASQLAGTSPLNALTFDANGGTGTFIAAEPGTTFDLTKLATFSKEPTWAGHTLLGWSTTPTSPALIRSPYAFTPGQTLYAQWGAAPSITTRSLAAGQIGTGYNQSLAATGTTPITWRLASGSLPPGITLAANGVIVGTPTAAGTYTFTVTAANALGHDTAQFAITITATPPPPSTDAFISPTVASFNLDKASAAFSDITLTLTPGGHQLLGLTLGGRDLQAGKDYVVDGDTVTILSAFLATLPVGQHTVIFVMSGGTNPALTVTITDTRTVPPPPLTGDNTGRLAWSTTLLAALLGVMAMLVWGTRHRRQTTAPTRPTPKHLSI